MVKVNEAPSLAYFAADQQQIDLAHQFVLQAQGEAVGVHLAEWGEGHVAGCADQCVELAGLLEQPANRVAVADVDPEVTAAATDANHFVALTQFFVDGRTNGAGGTDQQNLHGLFLNGLNEVSV